MRSTLTAIWCTGVVLCLMTGAALADDAQQDDISPFAPAGLSSPLSTLPGRVQDAAEQEGPIAGFWRVLSSTDREPDPIAAPPPGARGKAPQLRPLSLHDYLNQEGRPSSYDGTIVQYGF